jgi:t-SNARE complex subunit (syntaxin)
MKPDVKRKINVDDKSVETVSTIKEKFSKEEFENVIKRKQDALNQLNMQKRQIEMNLERDVDVEESQDLQKAKRLLGEKRLRKIIQEYMNIESKKRLKEQLEGVTTEIEIVEKDIKDFNKAIESK